MMQILSDEEVKYQNEGFKNHEKIISNTQTSEIKWIWKKFNKKIIKLWRKWCWRHGDLPGGLEQIIGEREWSETEDGGERNVFLTMQPAFMVPTNS